jgi:hypothetical protein
MDVAILREKYQSVNDFIRYSETTADWFETRVSLEADLQEQPDAMALIDKIVEIGKRTDAPGPNVGFILSDLHEAVAAHPELLIQEKTITADRLQTLEQIRKLGATIDGFSETNQREMIKYLVKYTDCLVKYLRACGALGIIVRDTLAKQLNGQTAKTLTPAERKLVTALGTLHLTGDELAKKLGCSYSGPFKTMLSNLIKRRILDNDKTGYHVIVSLDGG